jgi:hypothetical protein
MAEVVDVRLRKVAKELVAALTAEADRRSLTFRSYVVGELWRLVEGAKSGPYDGPSRVPKAGRSVPQHFVPPTISEAQKEIADKGYHHTAEEFIAYYETRGWKLKSGPMKNWRQAMVTWESKWKRENPKSQQEMKFVRREPVQPV